jgi:hypothetical protein
MESARSKKGIAVTKHKYFIYLLQATWMSGCQPTDTPIDANAKLWGEESILVDMGNTRVCG